MKAALLILVLVTSLGAQAAGAAEPSQGEPRERAMDDYLAAFSDMNQAELDIVEQLRALASSNPRFVSSEAAWKEAQNEWVQYSRKDCAFDTAADPVGQAQEINFMSCLARLIRIRSAQMRSVATHLQRVRTEPGTNPPIALAYDCTFTPEEIASTSPQDACVIREVADRCNEGDACLVRCLVNGGAKDIGGGCYHLCASYGLRRTPWIPSEGAVSCMRKRAQ